MNDAAVIRPPDCEHCGDTREVENAVLGVIRCPQCTVRAKPLDPRTMELEMAAFRQRAKEPMGFTAKELTSVERLLKQLVAHAAIDLSRFPSLPAHLVTTDRILQRWAAAPTGMPSDDPDVYAVARPPPLDPMTQEAVSDILREAPKSVRMFVGDWYCSSAPMKTIARYRSLSRRQLGREWQDVLVDVRGKFLASPHRDLVNLVRVAP